MGFWVCEVSGGVFLGISSLGSALPCFGVWWGNHEGCPYGFLAALGMTWGCTG